MIPSIIRRLDLFPRHRFRASLMQNAPDPIVNGGISAYLENKGVIAEFA
jgi:hypothetical protein